MDKQRMLGIEEHDLIMYSFDTHRTPIARKWSPFRALDVKNTWPEAEREGLGKAFTESKIDLDIDAMLMRWSDAIGGREGPERLSSKLPQTKFWTTVQ